MKRFGLLFLSIALVSMPGQALAQDQAANADPGLAVVKGSDCFTCHRVAQKITGPSYKEVAAKYAGADDAQIEALAKKVIAGGAGNWGNVPMKAHPNMSLEDAKKAVIWILAQGGGASVVAATPADTAQETSDITATTPAVVPPVTPTATQSPAQSTEPAAGGCSLAF